MHGRKEEGERIVPGVAADLHALLSPRLNSTWIFKTLAAELASSGVVGQVSPKSMTLHSQETVFPQTPACAPNTSVFMSPPLLPTSLLEISGDTSFEV